MKWLVTLTVRNGPPITVEVIALNREDAETRAAYKAEDKHNVKVERVIACRRY